MVHETTVERVTNRVWGIFSSLDHGIAGNNNRRALLRAYISSLAERGEHNADKLTVDGLDIRRPDGPQMSDKVDPLKTDAVKWADSPLAAPTKAA
jgi:hypothetical protein